MSTSTDDLRLMNGDTEVDTSLLAALDEIQDVAPRENAGWVPPAQRRLSNGPPLATSLPIRGAGDPTPSLPATDPSRYRRPLPSDQPTPAQQVMASANQIVEVTFDQVRAEGLEWLRDLARRKA